MSSRGLKCWMCVCGFMDSFENVQIHFLSEHRSFSEDFNSMCNICKLQFSDPCIIKQHSVLHIRQFIKKPSPEVPSSTTAVSNQEKLTALSQSTNNEPSKKFFSNLHSLSSVNSLLKKNSLLNNNNDKCKMINQFKNENSSEQNSTNNFQIARSSFSVPQSSILFSKHTATTSFLNSVQEHRNFEINNNNNNNNNQLPCMLTTNTLERPLLPNTRTVLYQYMAGGNIIPGPSTVTQENMMINNNNSLNLLQTTDIEKKSPIARQKYNENNYTSYLPIKNKDSILSFKDTTLNQVESKTYDENILRQILQRSQNNLNDFNHMWNILKSSECLNKMLQKENVINFYKCMEKDCPFSADNNNDFIFHLSKHTNNNNYKCVYCFSEFTVGITLVNHMIQEHGKRIYQCSLCFYRASRKLYTQIHQKIYHKAHSFEILICKSLEITQENNKSIDFDYSLYAKPFHCSIGSCCFVTFDSQDFKEHNELHHKFVGMYPCSYCKSTCFSINNLIKHHHLHGINNYQCTYCLYGSSTKIEMLFHLSTQHADMPVNVYVRSSYEGFDYLQTDKNPIEKLQLKDKLNNKHFEEINKNIYLNDDKSISIKNSDSTTVFHNRSNPKKLRCTTRETYLENISKDTENKDFHKSTDTYKEQITKINFHNPKVTEKENIFSPQSLDNNCFRNNIVKESKALLSCKSTVKKKKFLLSQKNKKNFSEKFHQNIFHKFKAAQNCFQCNKCNYECNICLKHFKLLRNMKKHLKDVHCLWSSLKCAYCLRMGIDEHFLRRHIITKHPQKNLKIVSFINRISSNSTIGKTDRQYQYNCYFCSFGTDNKCQMIKHIYTELDFKKYKCGICKLQLNKRSIPDHFSVVHPNRVIDIAKNINPYIKKWLKTFLQNCSELSRKNDICKMTDSFEFNCLFCQKQIKSQQHFRQHLYRHKQYKPFRCGHCNKKFFKICHFKIHKKNINESIKKKTIKLFKTKIWHVEKWAEEIIQNQQYIKNNNKLAKNNLDFDSFNKQYGKCLKLNIHYVGIYRCFYCNFCANLKYLVERHCRTKHFMQPLRFLKNSQKYIETECKYKLKIQTTTIKKKCPINEDQMKTAYNINYSHSPLLSAVKEENILNCKIDKQKCFPKENLISFHHDDDDDDAESLKNRETIKQPDISNNLYLKKREELKSIFKCGHCTEKFISLKSIQKHWEEIHRPANNEFLFRIANNQNYITLNIYRCMYCNIQSPIMKDLKSHIDHFHNDKVFMMKIVKNKNISELNNKNNFQYYCNYCDKVFIQYSELQSHQDKEHKSNLQTEIIINKSRHENEIKMDTPVSDLSRENLETKSEIIVNVKFNNSSEEIKQPLSSFSQIYNIYPKIILHDLLL